MVHKLIGLFLFCCVLAGCGGDREKINVVLISIDSLRPDHLGCYGYAKDSSPAVDGLASDGTIFLNAVSTTSWTLPAHVSLFTSLFNSGHRVNNNNDRIDPQRIMLAEVLKEHGYRTAGFVSGPFLHPAFAFDQGFDEYVYCTDYADTPPQTEKNPINAEVQEASHRDVSSPKVNSHALPWLGKNGQEPFFLFLHYFDVHYDYIPPPPYAAMFVDPGYSGSLDPANFIHNEAINASLPPEDLAYLLGLYDGEIRFTDDHVGAVIEKLKSLGVFEKTLIIVTSDHGDEFFEHGDKGHFKTLFEESIRIPLVMHLPGKIPAGRRVSSLVRIIDVMPTVLDLCGLPRSEESMGTSLLPLLQGGKTNLALQNLAELYVEGHAFVSLQTDDWKVVYNLETKQTELYRLHEDPREQNPILLTPDDPDYEKARKLFHLGESVTAIGKALPAGGGKGRRQLDPDTLRKLKSLGYME